MSCLLLYFLGDFGFSDGFGMVDVNTLIVACNTPYSNAAYGLSSPSLGSSDVGRNVSPDVSLCDERPEALEVPMEISAPVLEEPAEFLNQSDFGECNLPAPPVTPARPVLPDVNGEYVVIFIID